MAKRRQCPRCGRWSDPGAKECAYCATRLTRTPWRMTPDKLAHVHALARRKGLITRKGDKELYRLRLRAVGVESAKQLRRAQFYELVKGMQGLPDAF